jgi:hypothetical protein
MTAVDCSYPDKHAEHFEPHPLNGRTHCPVCHPVPPGLFSRTEPEPQAESRLHAVEPPSEPETTPAPANSGASPLLEAERGLDDFEPPELDDAPGPTAPKADAALANSIRDQMGFEMDVKEAAPSAPGLAEKFLVPPFSILDTRQDYWQKRRRAWLSIGIRGETSAERPYTPQKGGAGKTATGVYAGHGNAPLLKAERNESGGRKRELIYDDSAPGGDPSFYGKKRATEERLDEERRQRRVDENKQREVEGLGPLPMPEPVSLSTEEFQRDYYAGRDSGSEAVNTGTSVFDPLLCEIAYRWWSPDGGRVLDPFAGGVVRGLVAGALGRRYTGTELRPEQIADNREQVERLFSPASGIDWGREPVMPTWIEHDATKIGELSLEPADLIFTCPPYADLEVYSDDPRDLSTMPYEKFRECIYEVMAQTEAALRQHRFAVWVVGEARGGPQTAEYGFVADAVKAAQAAGMGLYNSAILINSVGSAALRAQRILRARKLTRVHQHVLVFLKGDPKKAAAACGAAALDV